MIFSLKNGIMIPLICFCIIGSTFAQQNEDQDFKNLQQASSTANTLLGIAESDIARPSDPTDFLLTLRQATNNYTSLPLKYGIEISPTWVFNGNSISANSFLSDTISMWDNIRQSFTLSLAFDNEDKPLGNDQTIPNSSYAIGAKVSFLRGSITSETNSQLVQIQNLMSLRNRNAESQFRNISENEGYQLLQNEFRRITDDDSLSHEEKTLRLNTLNTIMDGYLELFAETIYRSDTILERLNSRLKDFKIVKEGWKLDLHTAASWNMPEKLFKNNKLDRYAVWLSGGYEVNNLSILGIARYQYTGEQSLLEISKQKSIDAGLRAIYTSGKLSLSFEAIYRKYSDDPTYKYIFNVDYLLGNNARINLSFGKDFDGVITKNGNVISAFNFLKGFGGRRPVGE